MNRFVLSVISAVALSTAFALAAQSMSTMHGAASAKVTISAVHNSGQSGSAMLVQKGNDVLVTVTMQGIPAGVSEPTHIHAGTCGNLTPAPKYPLTNSKDGTSTTTLAGVKLSSLLGGKYAINVHNSKNLSIYVACGNIK
jgi:Cu/Zn superoxide dismutase